ncbi:adenylate/guanylate cyclase domain-containing protein [Bradyrhizobium canariense]|uniref:adenylate/guanylate cyclase domain-containing protein n=1 Tax=Bradyrhizobium canariense TaxID=255045 RepID=UPI001FD9167C|nr:tetratricopeptide repeat protein [Bradyrhizobium canariense]
MAAILAADVVGYSAMMERAEEATYAEIGRLRREIIEPALTRYKGRLIKTTGDGVLAEFASAVSAVQCGKDIQDQLAAGPLQLRIGINLGEVIVDDQGDVYGEGINIAARLEGLAEPCGILISEKVQREINGRIDLALEDQGEKALKNISVPVRAFALRSRSGDNSAPEGSSRPALQLPDKPSIAILPFQNMSGDPEQEYFADGMVEDIITALSRVKWFFVIARNSSFTYKGRAVNIKQVGRELGVRYVLEGSVRKAGNRVRITGQLIEAETGHHIWAERFEREYNDVFELQDEMTSAVAAAIEPTINLREIERSKKRPTSDLTAYDYFLRAQPFIRQFDPQSYTQAEELLRRAVSLDPQYSSALALLADCIGRQCIMGTQPYRERVLEAERIAQQAVQADPEDGTALAIASWVYTILVGKHAPSREYAERALRLQPNSAFVCVNSGFGYLYRGELDTARYNFERALRINPLDPRNYFIMQGLGIILFFERNFAEALPLFDRSIELAPSARVTWRYKAATLAHLGRTEEAREAVAALRSLTPVQTLKEISDRTMLAQAWMREMYIGGLEKAGYE